MSRISARNQDGRQTGLLPKLFAVVLSVVFAFCLVGCSSYSSDSSDSSGSSSTSDSPRSSNSKDSESKSVSTVTQLDPDVFLSEQALPGNGYVFQYPSAQTVSQFHVENGSSSNYFIKFVDPGTGSTVVSFFVRAHENVSIDMPRGIYELRMVYGSTWYGTNDLFGSKGVYQRDEDTYDFDYGIGWEISLYASNLADGQNLNLEEIDQDQF